MSLPELRQWLLDISATQHQGPLHGQGSITGPQAQALERGIETLDLILGDAAQGLKAA
jgi:hypothetical protein